MVKLKFCGLTRPEDIEIVNRLKPDYIGFVFYEKSKRNVDRDKAKTLKEKLDSNIQAVGVFVDEKPEIIADLANEKIIDIIQLHGNEDERYIENIRRLTDTKIIKAFQMKNVSRIEDINESSADFVLVDSGQGTGKAFDWKTLDGIKRPYFLAGGISPDNILEAIKINPYAIDLSSGIETEGVKDEEKMRKIIISLRR